jgi:alpha-ketoglutaric semialdehyde dehydrogenase
MAADWWPFLLFSNPKLQFIARLNDMVRGNLFGQQEVFGIKNQGVSSHSNDFVLPSKVELDRAMSLAIETHEKSLFYDKDLRKSVLEQIIEELKIAKHPLRQAYMLESNLSAERFDQEFNRVIHQIQQYVSFLSQKDGFRQFISIQDKFQDDQTALRKVGVPLGPIVVFGASNFPLAYSTVGGDVVSAMAAGCPVIVKGHPFHPETSFLSAKCIQTAVEKANAPIGVFAHFNTSGIEVGEYLVQHEHVYGVAFTGSYVAGKSLMDLASKRRRPIPVFAEMGSLNPVILMNKALSGNLDAIARTLAGSVFHDAGQFCTKPGVIFVPHAWEQRFLNVFKESLCLLPESAMLHPAIELNFQKKIEKNKSKFICENFGNNRVVLNTTLSELLDQNLSLEELFGPATCIVSYTSISEVREYLSRYDGFLTSSIFGLQEEVLAGSFLFNLLILRSGRFILNQVPTGVRVASAMHHGGPFPASSTPHFTAVGVDAIWRFLRPVTLQFNEADETFFTGF